MKRFTLFIAATCALWVGIAIGAVPLIPNAGFSPARLANNAAWYSLAGAASDSTYLLSGSNIKLIADRSGNSGVNCLVLNGVSGNYASFPAPVVSGTSDFSFGISVIPHNVTANGTLVSGVNNANGLIITSAGKIAAVKAGVTTLTASNTALSAFTPYYITYVRSGTTGTYYINGVADGTITDNQNYTVGPTQIGQSNTVPSDFLAACVKTVRIYSVALSAGQISADAAGSMQSNCVFNANFATAAKLATSFTESSSNAATVTINTTGDLGARISGERDLYQGTAAKQPIYSVGADGVPIATFDGSNDYMAGLASHSTNSMSVYAVSSRTGGFGAANFYGRIASFAGSSGTDFNTTAGWLMNYDRNASVLQVYRNSAVGGSTTIPAVDVRTVTSGLLDGTNLNLRKNKDELNTATTTGTAIAVTKIGVGVDVGALTADSYLAGTLSELLVRSVADDATTQNRIVSYMMARWLPSFGVVGSLVTSGGDSVVLSDGSTTIDIYGR